MDYSFKGGLPPPQKADLLLMDIQYFPMGFNFVAEEKRSKNRWQKEKKQIYEASKLSFPGWIEKLEKILKPLFYIDCKDFWKMLLIIIQS